MQRLLEDGGDPTSKLPVAGSISAILMSIVPLTEGFDSKIADERGGGRESSRVKWGTNGASPAHARLRDGNEAPGLAPPRAERREPKQDSPTADGGEPSRAGLCKGTGKPGLAKAEAAAAKSTHAEVFRSDDEPHAVCPGTGIVEPRRLMPVAGTGESSYAGHRSSADGPIPAALKTEATKPALLKLRGKIEKPRCAPPKTNSVQPALRSECTNMVKPACTSL